MGIKRSFDHVESPEAVDALDGAPPARNNKRGKAKHGAKPGMSEPSVRKRARDIKRLLQRAESMPVNVVGELKRELADHEEAMAEHDFQKKRSRMISKYHKVRFFERKKASRLIKQLESQMEQQPEPAEMKRLKQELHIAKVDEAYAINFPYMEPYISMYKTNSAEQDQGDDQSKDQSKDQKPLAKAALGMKRPPLWAVVEKSLEEGPAALKMLRERRQADDAAPKKPPQRKRADKRPTPVKAELHAKPEPRAQLAQTNAVPAAKDGEAGAPQVNRRERRRLMREAAEEAAKQERDPDEIGGFLVAE